GGRGPRAPVAGRGPRSRGRRAPRQQRGRGAPARGGALTAPARLRPPRRPGQVAEPALQAPPVRLRDHLALPFTDVLAADMGVHDHAPTLVSPVTGESSGIGRPHLDGPTGHMCFQQGECRPSRGDRGREVQWNPARAAGPGRRLRQMAGFTFTPLTPSAYLDRAAWVFRDRTAVIDGERSFTYAEFAARAHRLAGALLGLGVQPGDRVAALCVNSHVMLELHNGVPLAGAVLGPLHVRLSRGEPTDSLRPSGAPGPSATPPL